MIISIDTSIMPSFFSLCTIPYRRDAYVSLSISPLGRTETTQENKKQVIEQGERKIVKYNDKMKRSDKMGKEVTLVTE